MDNMGLVYGHLGLISTSHISAKLRSYAAFAAFVFTARSTPSLFGNLLVVVSSP